MQRCYQALATQKTAAESLWLVSGDSSVGIRSDTNLYFICCFSKLKMITPAATVSPVSETVMFKPGCPHVCTCLPWEADTHQHTHTPSLSTKDPSCQGLSSSEDSYAVRKNYTQQELHFHLPEILPFGRTRFFFLSSLFSVCYQL